MAWSFNGSWTRARRAMHQVVVKRAAALLGVTTIVAACHAPGVPSIDGVPGAPPNPSTPWREPKAVRTPPPNPTPPAAPEATKALAADRENAGSIDLSMADVIDLSLRNNPATRESYALALASADAYGSAKGARYPDINASVTVSRSSGLTGSFGGGGGVSNPVDTAAVRTNSGSSSRLTVTPALSLSYLIWDYGGRAGSIEAAKQNAIAANLTHNATVNNVVLQVESSVFSFVATRALRDAEVTAVAEARTDTAAAEARLRVGVGTLEDVLQTRTALAQARLQLETLEGNLLAARGNLAIAMGLPANARFDIPAMPATDSVARVAASVDTLINRAIAERPELAELRAEAASLAAQIRVARAAGYPSLTLSAPASDVRALQRQTGSSTGITYSLLLGLQIPIFNGFSRTYDLRAAKAQYEAGLARVTNQQQQITVQVYTSYAMLETATQAVSAAGELLTSAQQSADVALGRYREGVGTIVDLVLARTALEQARASDIQTRWQWQTALAQLAHDVGSIDRAGRPNVPLRLR